MTYEEKSKNTFLIMTSIILLVGCQNAEAKSEVETKTETEVSASIEGKGHTSLHYSEDANGNKSVYYDDVTRDEPLSLPEGKSFAQEKYDYLK